MNPEQKPIQSPSPDLLNDGSPAPTPKTNKRANIKEALTIFVLAAIPGLLFYIWHTIVSVVLPNSVTACANNAQDGLTLACHGTYAGDLFAYLTLFSLFSYLAYRLINKSYVLAFYYSGFFTACYFFMIAAITFNFSATYKLRGLLLHGTLWHRWLLPTLISGLVALIVYLIQKYAGRLAKNILAVIYIIMIALSLVFMPGIAKGFVDRQNKAGDKEYTQNAIHDIKNMLVTLYAPNHYTGPLHLATANASFGDPKRVSKYELVYDIDSQRGILVYIYKAKDINFNPPANCGDGEGLKLDYKLAYEHACKIILTTAKGRAVYAYRAESKIKAFGVDPNSEDVKKIQPDIFYVPMGDEIVSFSDPTFGTNTNQSPLTPEVVEQFVDSFEPVKGKGLEQFAKKYVL